MKFACPDNKCGENRPQYPAPVGMAMKYQLKSASNY